MITSERIFKLMEERGMTQIEFSRRTGISQSTISDWKRKKTNPAADKIMVICEVLNVSPYDILQDTAGHKSNADYRVVSSGTSDYDLLVEIDSLDSKQKERLMGYVSALKDKM
ncbi:MAG: helix-turn-helix transcriptional regulator [Lachnospiraceae bacterium]|nr:helix-turn-helix transcriptional regulator [Lachnospiraceae bacterium]